MGDRFIMSDKELHRKAILAGVIDGQLTLKVAADKIGMSYRQTRRIYQRYKTEGNAGLCHKRRGCSPANAKPSNFKAMVLGLYKTKYDGFGATLASEKMFEDDGITVHPETLRLWLLAANLVTKQRKRKSYRRKRDKREHFGELLQIDGSIHDWFSDGRGNTCLLNMVDDATNTTEAILDTGETTEVLLRTLKRWIEKYGVPNSVYVDLKNVYVSPSAHRSVYTSEETKNFCVFERVCEKLGITIIKAYSPQAKGRVERKHRVFQDRFVKEIKLYDIKTIEEANRYLEERFLPTINTRFADDYTSYPNMHRDASVFGDLDEILCWEYKRTLKHNWTIQLFNEHYQIEKSAQTLVQPEDKLLIREYLSGELKIFINNHSLEFTKLTRKKANYSEGKKYYVKKGPNRMAASLNARKNKHKTPWSRTPEGWLSKKKNSEEVNSLVTK